VFTAEHVEALAAYLLRRHGGNGPTTVLELGAGSGLLTKHLSNHLATTELELVATDSGEAALSLAPHCEVHRMSNEAALSRYQPAVVLVSWMVINQDWTAGIRACSSVREYLLIGETDDGCCGHPWETWGVDPDMAWEGDCSSTSSEEEEEEAEADAAGPALEADGTAERAAYGTVEAARPQRKRGRAEMQEAPDTNSSVGGSCVVVPLRRPAPSARLRRVYLAAPSKTPFGRQGFTRVDLDDEMGRWQLCRTDERWATHRNSTTVAFVRQPS